MPIRPGVALPKLALKARLDGGGSSVFERQVKVVALAQVQEVVAACGEEISACGWKAFLDRDMSRHAGTR